MTELEIFLKWGKERMDFSDDELIEAVWHREQWQDTFSYRKFEASIKVLEFADQIKECVKSEKEKIERMKLGE